MVLWLMEEIKKQTNILESYPILPLRNTILFPNQIIPIYIGRKQSLDLISDIYLPFFFAEHLCKQSLDHRPFPKKTWFDFQSRLQRVAIFLSMDVWHGLRPDDKRTRCVGSGGSPYDVDSYAEAGGDEEARDELKDVEDVCEP